MGLNFLEALNNNLMIFMFKIRVNAFLRNRFVGGNFFLQFRFVISTSAFKISIYIFKMNFYYLLGRIISYGRE